MDREKPNAGQLLGTREVVDVRPRMRLTGGAGTAVDQRASVKRQRAVAHVEPKPGRRQRGERDAVSRQAGRHRAIEDVDPESDPLHEVVGLADPQQVARGVRGQMSSGHRDDVSHLGLVSAQGAPDRYPVDRRRRDPLGRYPPQVLVDATLDDPEHGLASGPLALVPPHAAVEPPVGSLHRALGVVAVGVVRRALVEGQRQV